MFNKVKDFFTAAEPPVTAAEPPVTAAEPPVTVAEPPVTVAEIHEAIDNSMQEIIDEANKVLKESSEQEISEIEQLGSFGFINIESAGKASEIKAKKEDIEFINKNSPKYAGYKIVTEAKLSEILKKYGLIMGNPSQYIKDIPAENRREIVDFAKRYRCERYRFWQGNIPLDSTSRDKGAGIGWYAGEELHNYKSLKESVYRDLDFEALLRGEAQHSSSMFQHKVTKEQFKIIATLNMFDTTGMNIEDNILKRKMPPDPIVVAPISGGYVIVTKWGDEADIEEVN